MPGDTKCYWYSCTCIVLAFIRVATYTYLMSPSGVVILRLYYNIPLPTALKLEKDNSFFICHYSNKFTLSSLLSGQSTEPQIHKSFCSSPDWLSNRYDPCLPLIYWAISITVDARGWSPNCADSSISHASSSILEWRWCLLTPRVREAINMDSIPCFGQNAVINYLPPHKISPSLKFFNVAIRGNLDSYIVSIGLLTMI